jgi:hypothetical protein
MSPFEKKTVWTRTQALGHQRSFHVLDTFSTGMAESTEECSANPPAQSESCSAVYEEPSG